MSGPRRAGLREERKDGQRRREYEYMYDPPQPMQSCQMVHSSFNPTNDPPCLPFSPFLMSPSTQVSTRLLRVSAGQPLWMKNINDAMSGLPTGRIGVSTPAHRRRCRGSSTGSRHRSPPLTLFEAGEPHPSCLILSADDATKLLRILHAIGADFLLPSRAHHQTLSHPRE